MPAGETFARLHLHTAKQRELLWFAAVGDGPLPYTVHRPWYLDAHGSHVSENGQGNRSAKSCISCCQVVAVIQPSQNYSKGSSATDKRLLSDHVASAQSDTEVEQTPIHGGNVGGGNPRIITSVV